MTIALGILATDGIALAADSEISTNIDVKGVGTKLVAATAQLYGEPCSVGIAGAGSLGYFQSLRFKAVMTVANGMAFKPFADSNVEQALEGLMTDFYAKHVMPNSRVRQR